MGKIAILFALVAISSTAFGAPSKIDSSLSRKLKTSTANVFISFKTGTSGVLDSISTQNFISRDSKITTLYNSLLQNAEESQKSVMNLLEKTGNEKWLSNVKSFWITNQVFVRGADLGLVESIAALPEVSHVAEEEFSYLVEPVSRKEVSEMPLVNTWGVDRVNAPNVWSLDGGNNGANVIVGSIDTGVRYTHEILADNYVGGAHGWLDPYQGTEKPNDQNGHGTHVMGTIAGQNGFGVAPGAKWMACKGCPSSSCSQDYLLACGQFMLCPTDYLGNNPDCSKAPHLVSNSWGGGQGRTTYDPMVRAWDAADITPIFANGNSGPSCGTANSPADIDVAIGVGSTTSANFRSSFSSVGPSIFGSLKPEISAPGSDILSSYYTSDSAYVSLSGTSMACPHIAGVVALLKGRNPNLTTVEVKKFLTDGADRTFVNATVKACDGIPETTFPNYSFGYGIVDALKSITLLIQS